MLRQGKSAFRYIVLLAFLAILVLLVRDLAFLHKSSLSVISKDKLSVVQSTVTAQNHKLLNNTQKHDMYYSHTDPFKVPPDPVEGFKLGSEPPFIPHIIHQTWDTYEIPREFSKWIQSWVRVHPDPDWEFWFWTPKEVRLMLKLYYPDYLEQYDALDKDLYKANAMRFFIMHKFGGVYADLDLEAIKPLDPWTYKVHCLLPEETLAHPYLLHDRERPNTMITLLACRPGHPYFKLAIDRLPNYPNLSNPDKVLFVDHVYLEYNSSAEAHMNAEDSVVLAHPDYFLPTFDPGWKGRFQSLCSMKQLKYRSSKQLYVCDKFRRSKFVNKPLPVSYTNHHWFHVVLRSESWKDRNTGNINDLLPYRKNVTRTLLDMYNSTQLLDIR